jgi:hypothetical protein
MEILESLYRSKKLVLFEDGYGGTPLRSYTYSYLLFYQDACYQFSSIKPYEVVGAVNHNKIIIESFDDAETIKSLPIFIQTIQRDPVKKEDDLLKFESVVQVASQNGDIINTKRIYEAYISGDKKNLELTYWNEVELSNVFKTQFELALITTSSDDNL